MPFPEQNPREFTQAGIEALDPGQKGCYGLFQQTPQGKAWVYVGKPDDLRKRLLEHLGGDNACINKYPSTHHVGVVTDDNEARKKALILELEPECNKRVG